MDSLKQVLAEVSDGEASAEEDESDVSDTPSSYEGHRLSETSFIFGNQTHLRYLAHLHPSRSDIAALCQMYFARFDPLFKILHRPSLMEAISEASSNLNDIPGGPPQEALMFSIYYASVLSQTNQQCLTLFGKEKDGLIAQYKHGAETALSKSDFLKKVNILSLQAFCIYLVSAASFPTAWQCTALILICII